MAIYEIPITKAGKTATITVDDAQLSNETLFAVIREGLKVCLNAKMTSVGPVTKLEGRELETAHESAMLIAQKNLAALLSGDYKFPGTKSKSAEPREVMTEAHRLAKEVLRDSLRFHNVVLSHVPAKELTEAAKVLVEKRPDLDFIGKAKANIEKRKQLPTDLIDLSALGVHADPAKVAKAEEAKVKRKEVLSAAQAKRSGKGKVAPRSKPKPTSAEVFAATITETRQGPAPLTH